MLIFLFGTTIPVLSQENLVRNPSFEDYYWLPVYIGNAPGSIVDWNFAGELGSGDYYNVDAPNEVYGTKKNIFGHEDPHSGKGYGGFCVTPEYREFLCSRLKSPLKKGQQYKFTMYISNGDDADVSYLKEISVMFLSRQIVLNNDLVMGLPPQIVFYQDSGFVKKNGWQEITAYYTATGYEQWMYIGAHQWKCDTCKSVPGAARTASPGIFGGDKKKQAHYYVDDVSIVEVNPVSKTPVDTLPEFVTGKTYAFHNILFDIDSDELKESSYKVLDTIADYLIANPDISVSIFGHTDSTGDWHDNLKLSERRAEAVKNYFVYSRKISAARISTVGFGQVKPVASNSTPEGRALNRRVEFIFEPVKTH